MSNLPEIATIRRRAAAAILSVKGAWTQGQFRKPNEDGSYCYCLVGACREAAGYYAAADAAADAADIAADAAHAAYDGDAIGWNDAPGRTVEEVIEALLKGI